MFSPPESCLCHFSTWSKKVVIQLCFPLPKKKETHARPITHQRPKPIKSTPTAAEPNNHQPPQSPTPHLTHQPPKPNTSPSTTAAKDIDHRRCQSPRRAAATLPCLVLPLSPPSSRHHQASISNAGQGPSSQRQPLFPV